MFAPNGEFLGAKTRRADGMFVGERPVLAALLLAGEPPASMAAVGGVTVSSHLNLARVTQRTVRDLQVPLLPIYVLCFYLVFALYCMLCIYHVYTMYIPCICPFDPVYTLCFICLTTPLSLI